MAIALSQTAVNVSFWAIFSSISKVELTALIAVSTRKFETPVDTPSDTLSSTVDADFREVAVQCTWK